ncbi:Lrp/AsnC family transcriptional regulator [Sphingobium sp. BS19]|uniref:Lrp/AsnC family transcriptional regulator n=1 Tax=Sphingobium sp. BS19 TaxID=3018973 RepID=UPI0022ED583C|nr:Lrp/AsnC family transcriptional regulator [Sphingobium sp. BS19]GLJ00243.1 AsnC family transcriptional regulator [Sphingobium sp. BS19]
MDRIDRNILAAMQDQPDLSTGEIAERVGLSNTPCWRRIKKLEADGVIAGKVILLNAKALGLAVNVFAEIRLRQHDEETLLALEAAVARQPEIVECFSVSGESDYMARIVTQSIATYETFLKKVLLHLPGVAAVNSRFALGCVKMTTALPI